MSDNKTPSVSFSELKLLHGPTLQLMVRGLFQKNKHQYFDVRAPYDAQADFINSDEVFRASMDFMKELMRIWEERYPTSAQLNPVRTVADACRTVEKMQFPEFRPDVAPSSPTISSAAKDSSVTSQASTSLMSSAKSAPLPNTTAPSVTATLAPGQVPPVTTPPPTSSPQAEPPMNFQLPNCKVGVSYCERIEGLCPNGMPSRVTFIKFPDGLGLSFDPVSQRITGTPQIDGDFELALQWCYEGSTTRSGGSCRLTSNPDPRSLWKVLEPENGLPYPKSHTDHKFIAGAGFTLAAASRRGRSHEHGGSFRDDDFFVADDPDNEWSVLIVADGAGSAKNSREGSRLAVTTAGQHMLTSLRGEFGEKVNALLRSWDSDVVQAQQSVGSEFHYFFHKTASLAVQSIELEAQKTGAAAKEFATTLLIAVVKKEGSSTFVATFWMGDGAIAAYGPRGTVKLMGTPDGGEFAGQTRFLDRAAIADQGFGKRIRIGRLLDVSAVILMTDGVSDPYFETDNGLASPPKWDALWDEISPLLQEPEPEKRLTDWLHFFKQGHHDDRTIALLW